MRSPRPAPFFVTLLLAMTACMTAYVAADAATSQAHRPPVHQAKEGTDYHIIQPALPDADAHGISVTEFFSYMCPHCYHFSKPLREWSKQLPEDVHFNREAVSIGHEAWVPIARTFYALRAAHKLAPLDAAIFDAIHQQGIRMDDIGYITAWLSHHGIAPQDFDALYRAPAAWDGIEHSDRLAVQIKLPSVPTMVIDGKYMVNILDDRDFGPQLAVVEQLIARERAAKSKPDSSH